MATPKSKNVLDSRDVEGKFAAKAACLLHIGSDYLKNRPCNKQQLFVALDVLFEVAEEDKIGLLAEYRVYLLNQRS